MCVVNYFFGLLLLFADFASFTACACFAALALLSTLRFSSLAFDFGFFIAHGNLL